MHADQVLHTQEQSGGSLRSRYTYELLPSSWPGLVPPSTCPEYKLHRVKPVVLKFALSHVGSAKQRDAHSVVSSAFRSEIRFVMVLMLPYWLSVT